MKKVFALMCVLVLSSLGNLRGQNIAHDSLAVNPVTDSIVTFAKTFIGKPYKYACSSPETGFDCSGFTWFVFNHFNISVPRSARDYKTFGTEIPIEQSRKGDIIVFRGTHANDKSAGHVGIVISNPGEPLMFIHASSSDEHSGVVITDYYNSAYPKRFIKIVRVIK